MAARNRRSTLAAITLPLLFLAMSAIAQAATITVDTLSPTSVSGHCNLSDAINAANTKAVVQAVHRGNRHRHHRFQCERYDYAGQQPSCDRRST